MARRGVSMSFLTVSFWGALNSVFRLACGLAVTKIISVFVGPAGLAILGQFQSVVSLAHNFSNAGITNGVIKHIAEYSSNHHAQARVVQTASAITLLSTAAIAAFLVVFSPWLSFTVLHDADLWTALIALGALLLFASGSLSLSAVLNGQQRTFAFFAVQAVASLAVLVLVALMVPSLGLYGAMLAIAASQAFVFAFALFLCTRSDNLVSHHWLPVWHSDVARRLFAFSSAALVTAIAIPGSQLVVRELLISGASTEHAGYWQSTVRISEALVISITSVLTSYYLPRIAATRDLSAVGRFVKHYFMIVMPGFGLIVVAVIVFRVTVIRVLFTDAFLPAERLFVVQFAGDLVKMVGWIFGTVFIARARTSWIIYVELLSAAVFVTLAALSVPLHQDLGASWAYLGGAAFGTALLAGLYLRLLKAERSPS